MLRRQKDRGEWIIYYWEGPCGNSISHFQRRKVAVTLVVCKAFELLVEAEAVTTAFFHRSR